MFFWELRNYAQHHSKPVTGSPYSINSGKIRIELTINAKKVLERMKEKQLRTLNISDAIYNFKAYLEQNFSYFSRTKLEDYPKQLDIRLLIKEYIVLIKKINDEFNKELDLKFEETKSVLKQKIQHYCQDELPDSAFEIYRQNSETKRIEKRSEVSLKPIKNWELIIEKYSNLDLIFN
ncbi:hypothetical protein [Myxosarcina sp. GI1(2024)]